VSSTYRPVCLNHDPALTTSGEWSNLAEALAAVTAGSIEDHATCDLVIGCWSGALISITCPPQATSRPVGPHGWHPHIDETIGVEWLWLLRAAEAHADLAGPLEWLRRVNSCWLPDRLARLAGLIERESNIPAFSEQRAPAARSAAVALDEHLHRSECVTGECSARA
jgi:hypothetical protein